MIKLVPIQPG